jgi:hypothetical protein
MSTGPLGNLQTQIEGLVTLDIGRLLNWGKGIDKKGLVMEFIVVDKTQLTGWRILDAITKGFDRVPQRDKTRGDGSPVVFEVADLSGTIGEVLRAKGLHVRVDGVVYGVADIPAIDPNGAQVYTLICKTRTTRTSFDATK